MEAGLIPPRGLESYALQSSFHLALALPQLVKSPRYVDTYKRASDRGDYIVVDNGAAEGDLASNSYLLHAADALNANEIVAPDSFYNKAQTIIEVTEFLRWYADQPGPHYKIMAVAQGANKIQFQQCIDQFTQWGTITAVGLPRHSLTTMNLAAARINLANWINETYPGRFDIHLLGTNTSWLREISYIPKYAPFVRSVDSSLPFNYSLAGLRLESARVALQRHPEYFERDWLGRTKAELVSENVQTFLRWSDATVTEEARVS